MHEITPRKKTKPAIDRLTDEIRESASDLKQLGAEISAGGLALKAAAIRCGTALSRAKRAVGHGNWLKYLSDFHPDISHDTANRWMVVARKYATMRNLEQSGITALYRRLGIGDKKEAIQSTGTNSIDIVQIFSGKLGKRCDSLFSFADEFDLSTLPPDRKGEVSAAVSKAIDRLTQIREALV